MPGGSGMEKALRSLVRELCYCNSLAACGSLAGRQPHTMLCDGCLWAGHGVLEFGVPRLTEKAELAQTLLPP